MYICDSWYVLYVLVDCQLAWMGSTRPADSQLKINSASSWFHYMHSTPAFANITVTRMDGLVHIAI
jgi:hypothetical protein